MNVKLIIHNQATSQYKLKNNKSDEGNVVMRRQTWRADGDDKGNPSPPLLLTTSEFCYFILSIYLIFILFLLIIRLEKEWGQYHFRKQAGAALAR